MELLVLYLAELPNGDAEASLPRAGSVSISVDEEAQKQNPMGIALVAPVTVVFEEVFGLLLGGRLLLSARWFSQHLSWNRTM